MNIEKFITYLQTIEKIEETDLQKIRQKFKSKKCKKKEILISNNQVCDKVFFIIKGMLRAYYVDEKGLEKTRLISIENEFCSNWASFHNLSKNNEYIQCIEDCELVYVGHIYTAILEKFQVYHVKRFEFISNLTLTERLQKINTFFPNIQNRISNKILASFLHATPEHCSSAKKKLINLSASVITFFYQEMFFDTLTFF